MYSGCVLCRLVGGRLFEVICERGQLTELDAASYTDQLLDAVHYLQTCHVAHLDIKVSHPAGCTLPPHSSPPQLSPPHLLTPLP